MRRLALLGLLLWPSNASAHSPIEGIGDFYAGLLHPLLIPAQAMAICGLGLWLAQQDLPRQRWAAVALVPSLPLALALAPRLDWNAKALPVTLVALTFGLLAAMRVRATVALVVPAALLLSFVIGLDSVADNATGIPSLRFILGAWLSIALVVFALAVNGSRLTREWQRIGLRVVGAWIAAASAMVAALALVAQS